MSSIVGFKSIDAVTISGAGTTLGRWMSVRSLPRFSFQSQWTGTLAGTVTWETTNSRGDGSQPRSDAKVSGLTVPTGFTAGDPAGSASDFFYLFSNMAVAWIRPKLTWVSGSGVVTITAAGNGT